MVTPLPAGLTRRCPVSERRAYPRTMRNIRVLLMAEDSALEEPFGGWIIDTSRGGVRLRVPRESFPVGTLLLIRSPSASAAVPWTALRVKHCRQVDKNWEMGCEFVHLPGNDTIDGQPAPTCLERP